MELLLHIIVIITLINYVFCSEDKYNELIIPTKKAYIIAENCEKIYVCAKLSKSGLLGFLGIGDDILEECYFRDKYIDKINIEDEKFVNPDKCNIKRKALIFSTACYMSSNRNDKIFGDISQSKLNYYDIDVNNKMVLTDHGWCTYLYDIIDANWMESIPDDIKINQINIPGTHDSGTYDVGLSWQKFRGVFIAPSLAKAFGKTQDLNILEQLESGIRYLDIRLDIENKKYLSVVHDDFKCLDNSLGYTKYLYFMDVIYDCIRFLVEHNTETIIIHLKNEKYKQNKDSAISKLFTEMFSLNELEYFYKPFDNDDKWYNYNMVTLGEVRGKIVFFTRSEFHYTDLSIRPTDYSPEDDFTAEKSNTPIGYLRGLEDRGNCSIFTANNEDKCGEVSKNNFRYQDSYNLGAKIKWNYVENMLKNEYSKFNNKNNNSTHTLNFMNISFLGSLPISAGANYMNKQLNSFLKENSAPNEWFVLDFPTPDIIRTIYGTNIFTSVKLLGTSIDLNKLYPKRSYWNEYFYRILNPFPMIIKRSDNTDDDINENLMTCLQRKIFIDNQGNQQDLVKTDYKCVDNKLNKWRIVQSDDGKFYSIISAYDDKCLNYSGDKLYMQKCKNNNKYQEFTIKDDIICSRIDTTKCLNDYTIYPTVKEPKKYEDLTCSINFARLGIKCCSNQNTKVEYVDEIGNWGIENRELCGIGYSRCSYSVLDDPYPCCSSVNPEIVYTDELGFWGEEDGQWCGIGEPAIDFSVRIKNRKTQECLITNLHSDTSILLLGDCNHSVWTYQNEELILNATGKCLYAMNSQNARMIECSEADEQINHHIHFKIIDNKYICIKNNVDPEDRCLDGNTLSFETSKSDSSEWLGLGY